MGGTSSWAGDTTQLPLCPIALVLPLSPPPPGRCYKTLNDASQFVGPAFLTALLDLNVCHGGGHEDKPDCKPAYVGFVYAGAIFLGQVSI